MRRRFLALGCAAVALAGGAMASQGCGADAVGLCDFNECSGNADAGSSDGSLLPDANGEEGSVVGPGGEGGPGADGGDAGVAEGGTSCEAGLKYCGADAGCVDPTMSVQNCGACGNVCAGPTSGAGQAFCGSEGCSIQCMAPQLLCKGACVVNTGEPSSDPCVVSTATGIFVAPSGMDTATGTQTTPVQTIAKGVSLAKSGGLGVVYVCDATYTAPLTFAAAQDGVKVYAGLVCPGAGVTNAWTYEGKTATVAPSAAGAAALIVSGLGTGMTFEDFVFQSSNATGVDGSGNGNSSIAVAVENSSGMVFKRVTMLAGNGAVGSGGSTLDANGAAQAAGGNAPVSGAAAGGAACSATCPNGSVTVGGQGGSGSLVGADNGDPGTPPLGADAGVGGAGQTVTNGACSNGTGGASGTNGNGGAGSQTLGSISASGWVPGGTGQSGSVGQTAQGGGGGGGGLYVGAATGGGGSGGCGGCGGGLGTGGGAGGASIALMSISSTIALSACTLTSGTGGSGGSGGAGQTGQTGGIKGPEAGNGCPGGPGGNGGTGGGGGGGAGGSSFDLGYTGTAPTQSGTTLSTTGSGGGGGQPGANGAANGTGANGVFAQSKGF